MNISKTFHHFLLFIEVLQCQSFLIFLRTIHSLKEHLILRKSLKKKTQNQSNYLLTTFSFSKTTLAQTKKINSNSLQNSGDSSHYPKTQLSQQPPNTLLKRCASACNIKQLKEKNTKSFLSSLSYEMNYDTDYTNDNGMLY